MSIVCKKHQQNPEKIYHQCIGCELEWYRNRVKELELEVKNLPKAIDPTELPSEATAAPNIFRR